jgi:hypothetical protein
LSEPLHDMHVSDRGICGMADEEVDTGERVSMSLVGDMGEM